MQPHFFFYINNFYLYHWPLKDTISYNRRRIHIRNSQRKAYLPIRSLGYKSLYLAGAIIL